MHLLIIIIIISSSSSSSSSRSSSSSVAQVWPRFARPLFAPSMVRDETCQRRTRRSFAEEIIERLERMERLLHAPVLQSQSVAPAAVPRKVHDASMAPGLQRETPPDAALAIAQLKIRIEELEQTVTCLRELLVVAPVPYFDKVKDLCGGEKEVGAAVSTDGLDTQATSTRASPGPTEPVNDALIERKIDMEDNTSNIPGEEANDMNEPSCMAPCIGVGQIMKNLDASDPLDASNFAASSDIEPAKGILMVEGVVKHVSQGSVFSDQQSASADSKVSGLDSAVIERTSSPISVLTSAAASPSIDRDVMLSMRSAVMTGHGIGFRTVNISELSTSDGHPQDPAVSGECTLADVGDRISKMAFRSMGCPRELSTIPAFDALVDRAGVAEVVSRLRRGRRHPEKEVARLSDIVAERFAFFVAHGLPEESDLSSLSDGDGDSEVGFDAATNSDHG